MEKFSIDENKIAVDADGCPVVRLAAKIAKEYGARCEVVCDSAHVFDSGRLYGAKVSVVSQGEDSADFYIVNHISENDIVVTQDYGLAAMCLAKRAAVINQDGKIYSNENIGGLLERRAVGKKVRRAGGRIKGPPKRTSDQDRKFEEELRRLLDNEEI